VFGHSEGGIYALLLASGLAGPAPPVRAVGLLEPVPIRMLDLLEQGPSPPVTGAAQQGPPHFCLAPDTETGGGRQGCLCAHGDPAL
jgi:hypothetical protein